jgi:hypothetical protein
MRVKRSAELLQDECVLRWYNNVRRGSVVNSDIMLRALSLFCRQNNITLRQLLSVKVEDLLLDYVTRMEREGKAPGYILNVEAVRFKGKFYIRFGE